VETSFQPVRGTWNAARLPLALTAALCALFAATSVQPPSGRVNWLLEVGPGIAGMIALAVAFRRFPMTDVVYLGVFVHVIILVYGGYYTYALAPLGEWAKETFHLARNHYDRVGHLALGFFPALTVREVLLRQTPLRRGGWLTFLVLSVVLAVGAFWELLEWWVAVAVGGESQTAVDFLGSQGDVWDAQWDMFLALVGASVSLALLGRVHDRALARLSASAGGRKGA
jgi:putative membrane protein